MESKRTAVISDIHGSIEEFTEVLRLVDVKSPNVEVILLGDLISRGPDSIGVLRLAQQYNLKSTLGNHDKKVLDWIKSGRPVPNHLKFYTDLKEKDIDYIRRMSLYVKLPNNFIGVHAGIKPEVPIDQQTEQDVCYLRYTDKDRRFLSLKQVFKDKIPGALFWTSFGPFKNVNGPEPTNVVFGHNVFINKPKVVKYADGSACYGIDGGCVFGHQLNALVLEENKEPEVIQVQAKRVYYQSNFLADEGA